MFTTVDTDLFFKSLILEHTSVGFLVLNVNNLTSTDPYNLLLLFNPLPAYLKF